MDSNLIYDIGFHVGQDTDFYLRKGFRVLAVDANPLLIEEGRVKFLDVIEAGAFILINIGVGGVDGKLPFYINTKLSEWSSFDSKIGTGRGDYEILEVIIIPLRSLFVEHGCPYYLKIDIEGYDLAAIKSLRGLANMSKYISVENGQSIVIEELFSQGYHKFKFVNQANMQNVVLPFPAKEGSYVAHKFPFGASGPFGEEVDGPWLSREQVLALSHSYWNNPELDANIHGWFDLHASR